LSPTLGIIGGSVFTSGSDSDGTVEVATCPKDDGLATAGVFDNEGLVRCPMNDVTSYCVALESSCLPGTKRVGELGTDGTSADLVSKEVGTSRRESLALCFARMVLNDAREAPLRSAAGGSGNMERENSLRAEELVNVLIVRLMPK